MHTKVLAYLQSIAEEKYKVFSLKLLPKDTMLLGVRIPLLKKIAKQIKKNNEILSYLNTPIQILKYQEEKMLYSLLISSQDIPEEKRIDDIKNYVPYIKNWSECDTFISSLKSIKNNQILYYNNFLSYTKSTSEYEIRFFYVMALNYFINNSFLPQILSLIKTQKYYGYYDRMAVAWFLSMAFVNNHEMIKYFLKETPLDAQVYKKTISKINDSYQIKKELKTELKSFLSSCN